MRQLKLVQHFCGNLGAWGKQLLTLVTVATMVNVSLLSPALATSSSLYKVDPKGNLTPVPVVATPSHVGVPAGTKLAKEQRLVVPVTLEVPQYVTDPALSGFSSVAAIARTMYEGLVRYTRDGNYIPAGAKSYRISADGKTWTFYLRDNAKWSDGTTVSARDYVYAWTRLAAPQTNSRFNSILADLNLENAQEVITGKMLPSKLGIRAIDNLTLELKLTRRQPYLLQLLTSPTLAPVRPEYLKKTGQQYQLLGSKPITNGAFKITKIDDAGRLWLEKNNYYWDKANVACNSLSLLRSLVNCKVMMLILREFHQWCHCLIVSKSKLLRNILIRFINMIKLVR